MTEIARVMNELEQLLDELLLTGFAAVPPSFFAEMERECRRHGLAYAAEQLRILGEEREQSRFSYETEYGRAAAAFCRLQQYMELVQKEMLSL
ncbi:hypothetical protein [Ectobacillus ponti]|uniref:Uncharacterized protein n=1 Tax=Ectobacillus ponti TaxID=2961894 RepID=A0AA41XCX0_9BACI|nr:hypothetical protein [Ectobacillus ponti]MCP8969766.1 hypothetical protein [Ectobacillus ponti]